MSQGRGDRDGASKESREDPALQGGPSSRKAQGLGVEPLRRSIQRVLGVGEGALCATA